MQFGSKAVSPLIATVLVTLFSVVMLGIAIGVVNPTFRRAQDTSAVNDQFSTLQTLNAAIKEVASEPDGSRRIVPITVTAGTLRVNSTYDWLYFEYEPLETLGISGTKGDIRIDQGLEFVDYFSSYADGAKATPAWTNTSGQAVASSGTYSITNGTSYHNVSTLENWKFSASIANVSGSTGGEAFTLPGNPERLVGYWTGDEATGNTFYDWSGHGNTGGFVGNNNGTLTNMNTTGNATSGWTTIGRFGNGMMFDGVNDYISLGNSSNFAFTGDFSLDAWIKTNYSYTTSGVIFGKYKSTDVKGYWFGVQANTNKLYFETYDSSTTSVTGTTPVNDGNWHHIIAMRNGTTLFIYLDGVQNTNATGTLRNVAGTANLSISKFGENLASYFFNGTIDDAKIWNRALSDGEVLSEYSGARAGETLTASTNTTGLAGWWKFNEGSGASAADDSTRDYGKYDGAMRFDGVNDYVDVPSSPSLKPTEAITVAAWIKPNLQGTREFVATKWAGFTMELTTSNTAIFGAVIGGTQRMTPETTVLPNDTWTHLVGTYDSTEKISKLYMNGGQEIKTLTLPGPTYSMSVSDNSLGIGKYSTYYWNGLLDEVMIFNRSLSADEVAALYETSAKKLSGAGGTQSVAAKTPNPAIVLSNPAGTSKFDNVEVTNGAGKLTLMVPYTTVELNGTLRLQKGEHRVQIRHMVTNATTNKPIVELTAV